MIQDDNVDSFIELFDNMKIINTAESFGGFQYYHLEENTMDESINIDIPLTNVFIAFPESIEKKMYEFRLQFLFNNMEIEGNNDDLTKDNYEKCFNYFTEITKYLKKIKENNFNSNQNIDDIMNEELISKIVELMISFYQYSNWDVDDMCYNDFDNYTKILILKLKYYLDNIIMVGNKHISRMLRENKIKYVMNLNNVFQLIFYILYKID